MDSPKMLSLLQIDGLGKRYGILPSEILRRADTFDLYVMDSVLSWENFQHKKQNSKNGLVTPDLNTDQLLEILNNNKKNRDGTS